MMTETTNTANETITDSKILLTSYEAAEFLHISYWHLMDLVRRKKIPNIRFSRKVFFKQASLEKYINDLEAQSVM